MRRTASYEAVQEDGEEAFLWANSAMSAGRVRFFSLRIFCTAAQDSRVPRSSPSPTPPPSPSPVPATLLLPASPSPDPFPLRTLSPREQSSHHLLMPPDTEEAPRETLLPEWLFPKS